MKHTVKEVVLQNGLKGLVLHVPNAVVVSFELSFRAGEFLLSREKWETAHLLEHLMLGAHGKYKTARDFQAELEKNGAYNNASTSAYDVAYEFECATFDAERVMNLVIGALESPAFLEKEFKAEVGNVTEELVLRSNNHFRALNIALRESLGFYAVNDTDRSKLIKHVTLEDIEDHYKSTHNLANGRFIIAGNITDNLLTALETINLPKGTIRATMPPESPKKLRAPIVLNRSDVPNIYYYIDTYAPKLLTQKERDALSVLSVLLTESLHSRLLGEAREQGLVYAMGSGQQHLAERSSFWIGAQVSKQNITKLFNLTKKVLQDIKTNGVPKQELDAALQYMQGKQARSVQTVSALAGKYSQDYFSDDTITNEIGYNERIAHIESNDIQAVLQLITSSEWALGLLGNITTTQSDALYALADSVLH